MPTQTFTLDQPLNLNVRVGRGAVTVTGRADTGEARVTITPRHPDSDIADRFTVEFTGSTLLVHGPREGGLFDLPFFGSRGRDAVDVTVEVPNGTRVKVATFSADVTLHGRLGTADLATGAAQPDIEQLDGNLRVRYGSGSCRTGHICGSVEARSGSGRAQFGRIDGSLNAVCGSGELVVGEVHGTVRSRSGSGTVSLAAVHGDVDVASGSGPMSIGLPPGRPARLDVTTGSGTVTSDLPIEGVPTTKGQPLSVRARTGSGDIRLFRAAEESAA